MPRMIHMAKGKFWDYELSGVSQQGRKANCEIVLVDTQKLEVIEEFEYTPNLRDFSLCDRNR